MLWLDRVKRILLVPSIFFSYFFSVVVLRVLLEGYSQRIGNFISEDWLWFFGHSLLFYAVSFLGLGILLSMGAREDQKKSIGVILFLIPLILLPPIADLLISKGAGGVITYRLMDLSSGNFSDLIKDLFKFLLVDHLGLFFLGGKTIDPETLRINYGVRIELNIILLFVLWYVFLKTGNALRSIGSFFLANASIWFLGGIPFILAWFFNVPLGAFIWASGSILKGTETNGPNQVLLPFLFLIFVLEIVYLFYRSNKDLLKTVFKNIRPNGVIANALVLNLGVAIGLFISKKTFMPVAYDIAILISANLSILFSWLWAVSRNDIADIKGDSISMPTRPLPQELISVPQMKEISRIFMILTLTSALISGLAFFCLTLGRLALGIFYSERPFRLKRFLFISNFLIALVFLLRILSGFSLFTTLPLSDFPARIALAIMILGIFATHFKDIKDYEGDKAEGIWTLPVIFGLEKSKNIIALFGVVGFLLVAALFANNGYLLFLSLLGGGLYYYLVSRKTLNNGWPTTL